MIRSGSGEIGDKERSKNMQITRDQSPYIPSLPCKSHISKTMGVAFIGSYVFEDSIENGGEAVKPGFLWAQSYKVAEKIVHEGV
jgi:hypothetical protein